MVKGAVEVRGQSVNSNYLGKEVLVWQDTKDMGDDTKRGNIVHARVTRRSECRRHTLETENVAETVHKWSWEKEKGKPRCCMNTYKLRQRS